MTNYRRNFVPGGSCFFSVNLAERKSRLLTDHIDWWPYSSFSRMVRLGVYPGDWGGDVAEETTGFGER